MVPKTIKRVGFACLALLVLAFIGAGVLWLRIDAIAKRTVENSSTNALGLATTTRAVSVSLLSGNVGVDAMRVANLEGYRAEHLLTIKGIGVSVEYGTLFDETLRIPVIEIEGITFHIERKGLKTNVEQMLAEMRRRSDNAPSEPKRKLIVGRLVVRDLRAVVQLVPLGESSVAAPVVTVPELVFDDVTPENASAVATEEVLRRVIPTLLKAILKEGADILPADLAGALGDEVGKALSGLGKGLLKDAPEAVGQAVEEGAKEVGERLRGVFEKKEE